MSLPRTVVEQVRRRAGDRCEYCRQHQSLQGATFHVEHILPLSRGGDDGADNLAWACPSCNLRKTDRVEAIDPLDGSRSALFHPRRDEWAHHFAWNDVELLGLTPTGRATVARLDLNHPRRILIRRLEVALGLFHRDGS
jgi:hypothetical protein